MSFGKRWAVLETDTSGSSISFYDEYADALIARREGVRLWDRPIILRFEDGIYVQFDPEEDNDD